MASNTTVSFAGTEIGLTGEIELPIERINVILGANGTGKSRLLKKIAEDRIDTAPGAGNMRPRFWPDRNVVLVEGGRVIRPGHFNTEPGDSQPDRGRAVPFGERVHSVFASLATQDIQAEAAHITALSDWSEKGNQGPPPIRPAKKIPQLLALLKVHFPDINLEWKRNSDGTRWLAASRGAQQFSPNALSDGEKEILALVIGLTQTAPDTVFLVDEPELHLNPLLAETFWTTVEAQHPDGLFVYATHSIGFAMRGNVQRVFVLSRGTPPLQQVDTPLSLEPDVIRDFLGAVPAIMAANCAIAVEGRRDGSFDLQFYRWVVGNQQVAVVPLESCNDVRAAAQHQGLWAKLAPSAQIAGVIDRDYRDRAGYAESLVVLRYHEAESYLCEPQLVHDLVARTKTASVPTVQEVSKLITDWCLQRVQMVARKRYNHRATRSISASLPSEHASKLGTLDAVRKGVRQMGEAAIRKAEDLSPDNVAKIFEEELTRCNAAAKSGNVSQILEVFEGKELLKMLLARFGFKDEQAMLLSAVGHLRVEDYPHLVGLREQIENALRASDSPSPAAPR